MEEERTSRRRFVQRLGTTLAVGLGIGLLGAGNASAGIARCCRSSSCDSQCPGAYGYLCNVGCAGCCTCEPTYLGTCHDYSPSCPC